MFSNTALIKNISLYNPWHIKSEFRISTAKHKRDLFPVLLNSLDKEISISISGLRRTGKTTLQQQLINHLLDNKLDQRLEEKLEKKSIGQEKTKDNSHRYIFYYIFNEDDNDLEVVLDSFFSIHTKDDYYKKDFYIFLDELQFVKNWQVVVKKHYDLNNKIRFIISGSSSVYLQQNTRESLAGRIIDYKISPLTFSEFIHFKHGVKIDSNIKDLLILSSDNDKSREEQLVFFRDLASKYSGFLSDMGGYLKFGEFPKLVSFIEDQDFNSQYLQSSILDKILKKDIKVFNITKMREVESLYKSSISSTSQVFSVNKASSKLEISYPSIKKYLRALELSYLLKMVKNNLNSVRSQEVAPKKVFSTSINLVCHLLNIENPLSPAYLPFKGHIVENYVYNHLKSMSEVSSLEDIFYYNHNEKKVDFVFKIKGKTIPIEVKSKSKLKKTDFNYLFWFMKKKKIDVGYMLYDGEVDLYEGKNGELVYLLPWWII